MGIQPHFETNKVLTLGIVNMGACQTLLDDQMCTALGNPIKQACGGEYSMYLLAGQTEMILYLGVVNRTLTLTLAEGISMTVDNIRVVQHLYPLLLIGSNVLSRGRAKTWSFGGGLIYTIEAGKCNSTMHF